MALTFSSLVPYNSTEDVVHNRPNANEKRRDDRYHPAEKLRNVQHYIIHVDFCNNNNIYNAKGERTANIFVRF